MTWPRFTIRRLMFAVAAAAVAAGGWVFFAGMDERSGRLLIPMALLLALHLVGCLVATLFIAASTSAVGRIGSLLGGPAAPARAAGAIPPDPKD